MYVYNTYTYVCTHIYAHICSSGSVSSGSFWKHPLYLDIIKMGLNPSPMPPGHRLLLKHLIRMGYSCRLSLEWNGRIQAFGLGTKSSSLIIFVLRFSVLLVS